MDSIPPSFASHSDTYSSAIIPRVCAAYKQIWSQAWSFYCFSCETISVENGITGISGERIEEDKTFCLRRALAGLSALSRFCNHFGNRLHHFIVPSSSLKIRLAKYTARFLVAFKAEDLKIIFLFTIQVVVV